MGRRVVWDGTGWRARLRFEWPAGWLLGRPVAL